jgi:hypothetical protein
VTTQQGGLVTDEELAPYVDVLPRALRGRDAGERFAVLRVLRPFAEQGYSAAQVGVHANATKLPAPITSPAGVLHLRLLRLAKLPSARELHDQDAAQRAAAAAAVACDHGEPRGCASCACCRRGVADVDGVRCRRCLGRRP